MTIRHATRSRTPCPAAQGDGQDDVYLTIEEAAAVIRSTPAAIYQMRRRGQGPPARRPGARLLFKRSELMAWLDAQADGRWSARPARHAA